MKKLMKNSCVTFVVIMYMIDIEWVYDIIDFIVPTYAPAFIQANMIYLMAVIITAAFMYIKSLINEYVKLFIKSIKLKLHSKKGTA